MDTSEVKNNSSKQNLRTNKLLNTLDIKLNGVTFNNRQQNIANTNVGEKVIFIREANNEYDKNAVHVYNINSKSLGFIPKEKNQQIAKALDEGKEIYGEVIKKIGNSTTNLGIIIKVHYETPDNFDDEISFTTNNDNYVGYHSYDYNEPGKYDYDEFGHIVEGGGYDKYGYDRDGYDSEGYNDLGYYKEN